jgi:hypothetical protein
MTEQVMEVRSCPATSHIPTCNMVDNLVALLYNDGVCYDPTLMALHEPLVFRR